MWEYLLNKKNLKIRTVLLIYVESGFYDLCLKGETKTWTALICWEKTTLKINTVVWVQGKCVCIKLNGNRISSESILLYSWLSGCFTLRTCCRSPLPFDSGGLQRNKCLSLQLHVKRVSCRTADERVWCVTKNKIRDINKDKYNSLQSRNNACLSGIIFYLFIYKRVGRF